jgi:predicted transcriptional regulator
MAERILVPTWSQDWSKEEREKAEKLVQELNEEELRKEKEYEEFIKEMCSHLNQPEPRPEECGA